MVHGGQGLGHTDDGRTCFVWNSLPGEIVEADSIRKKDGIIEAVTTQVYESSPHRIHAQEEHFLSCSPWQTITFDYENQLKQQIALETYNHIGKLELTAIPVISTPDISHYRNKMEYSFVWDDEGKYHIGFFIRGSHRKQPTPTCMLAKPEINLVTEKIVDWIQQIKPPLRTLKSLILRSNSKGEVLAGLFVKDLEYASTLDASHIVEQIPQCKGLYIYYSRPLSPASTTDKLIAHFGEEGITTEINGTQFSYGLMSFFQVNEPIFEKALIDIGSHLDHEDIVDYFSGVGAIAIGLKDKVKNAILIESNKEAVEFAFKNIEQNKLGERFTAFAINSEDSTEFITKDRTIIFDPPRAGLHKDTIQKVLQEQPKKIIYMSCNISTHARDIQMLSEKYHIKDLKIYNFFPKTPHIEGLAVLHRM